MFSKKKRADKLFQKYKEMPEEKKAFLHKQMQGVTDNMAGLSKDAEPFIIQIAVENLTNQRNLAIIAGSLATVSILMPEKLANFEHLWIFGASLVGLLLTVLFAVVGSAVDVERGSKSLRFGEAHELFQRQKEIAHKFILEEITPTQADQEDAVIRDEMMK